ncbi:helix-turn-helix domain-containing protein [Rhodanobacter ginsengiterrae]|uniref:helix-turn-helix domain-containing protein n=1 Tax=Rhodanobacter ginsengiterrae TaxID=2008451 RepID=UPI003CE8B167
MDTPVPVKGRQAALPCRTFSTALVEPLLRSRAYARWISALAEVLPEDDAPMDASIIVFELGPLRVARSSASPARYRRDAALIARSPLSDCVLLRLLLSGSARGNFGKRGTVELRVGDIYLNDLAQPVELWEANCAHVNLLLGHKAIDQMHPPLHGRVLRKDHLPCRMLTQHLLHLLLTLPDIEPGHAGTAASATLAVVRGCLRAETRQRDRPPWAETLHVRIREHIDAQLGDHELGAAVLQRRFHVSRAQLYRMFADSGGVQHYIRERRVEAVHRDLREQPDRNISDLAFRHGFSSERQFQRAFRARYGRTASEVRERQESF